MVSISALTTRILNRSSTIISILLALGTIYTVIALYYDQNPFLEAGEMGVEIDGGGKAVNAKIGPGNWNDLSYIIDSI